MMEKFSLYPGSTTGGFPHTHLIEPGSCYGLDKTASAKLAGSEHLPEVHQLVEAIQPQPDRLYLLNSSLGAEEVVGVNLRGDSFPIAALRHTPKGWDDIPVWDIDARRQAANSKEKVAGWGDLAWGLPTFYNAHRFRHHQNKDPNRAYGYVLGSFWDEKMKRVILITELIKSLCEKLGALDLYNRIEGGEFPDSSMGTRVPFDRCLICGNMARTPAQYCKHVSGRDPKYGMKKILPDGRICGVANDYPRFFDDSFVFIGADRSAKVMTNLTELVNGDKPYDQKIYVHTPGPKKEAEAVPNASQQFHERAQEVADSIKKDITAGDHTFESKLLQATKGLPVLSDVEQAYVKFFSELRTKNNQVGLGQISKHQVDDWALQEKQRLESTYGIPVKSMQRLDNMVEESLTNMFGKSASTKWAEMLKEIPMPSEDQIAIVRTEERKLPPLRRGTLKKMAEDPSGNIRAAAQLGVVLRPEEFQYVMLKAANNEMADHLFDEGVVFSPREISLDRDPAFSANTISPKVKTAMTEVLLEEIPMRSFAPDAVAYRVQKLSPSEFSSSLLEKEGEFFDEVSDLYNEYRSGLLAEPPDWRYVHCATPTSEGFTHGAKLATAAEQVSTLLLQLAYWPAMPLG